MYDKIVDLIYQSVISEGGDGDAYWLCKNLTLDELFTLIKDYSDKNFINWEITMLSDRIDWGDNQEWAFITNNKKVYDDRPSWIILSIVY